MPLKSAALQEKINSLDLKIQQGASDAQLNLWEMQRDELKKQYAAALEEESQQQATTERIGYLLDSMTVEGLTIAEIITNDDEYKLVRKGVQDAFIFQAEVYEGNVSEFQDEIKGLNEHIHAHELERDRLQTANTELEVKNYELGLVNDELNEKVRKVAELQHESNQQIEQQKQHIDELQKQLALGVRGALNVVDLPQDTSKMAAEIIARKVRITNVRFKDENGIDTRIKKADNVLTGEPVEYEAIYEKRYIILNEVEAGQYRADEANKKAEAEQLANSIPETKEPGVEPVNRVTEEEAPAQENSFQENVEAIDNAGLQNDQGNSIMESVVSEESEVITLESLHERVKALELKVAA